MHHDRYDYSPIIRRRPLKLPNKARVALWLIPNVEYFHFDRPGTAYRPGPGIPDVLNHSWREYGMRIGIWRLMDVFDKHGVRGTVALNAEVCTEYPVFIEEAMKRNWVFMGHGLTNSQYLHTVGGDEEQRAHIRQTLDIIAKHTGALPKGWLGPGLAETAHTPDLLAEEGIEYLCDWVHDDQPIPMRVRGKRLITVPYSVELNDIPVFIGQNRMPEQFVRMIADQFDTLYAEGATNARIMAIALHPFLIGAPHRIKYLDQALAYICRHEGVWLTTANEIADWYYANYYQPPT